MIDISKNRIQTALDEANRLNISNIKFITRDITKLNFSSDSFDIIYAHLALHYFSKTTTEKVFKSLQKITKKNGSLFIKVKSVDDPELGKGKKLVIIYLTTTDIFDIFLLKIIYNTC